MEPGIKAGATVARMSGTCALVLSGLKTGVESGKSTRVTVATIVPSGLKIAVPVASKMVQFRA